MNNKRARQKICIFTQSPLSRAPRVVKEANVYAKHGYHVIVYGLWISEQSVLEDKALIHSEITYKAGIDLRSADVRTKCIRLQRRIGRELVKFFKIETISSLGYNFNSYLKKLECEQADLYIGHEEMSMALSKKLIELNKTVAFDFEDWHSKDLLPKDRVYRPLRLLETLEEFLLNHANYCYTTSDAMAVALSQCYNTKIPATVYNAFPAAARAQIDGLYKDKTDKKVSSLYWFSQVISEGRGLELLFEALPFTKYPFELHLRGAITEAYRNEIKKQIPEHIKLIIHELVPMDELISRIAEHDLGLAIEETSPESRNYTITNKIFHYLQSGIPVLATETAGQLEIAKKSPDALCMVDRNPETLGCAIDSILSQMDQIKLMKEASNHAGEYYFAFEVMEQKLLEILENALKHNSVER